MCARARVGRSRPVTGGVIGELASALAELKLAVRLDLPLIETVRGSKSSAIIAGIKAEACSC